MRELKINRRYSKFTHREDSRYQFEDYDDDGLHVNYIEIDKEGFSHYHKVPNTDKEDWDNLCNIYPITYSSDKKDSSKWGNQLTEEEYNKFIDTGKVSILHLYRISMAVKNGETLSAWDYSVFMDKTDRINKIIKLSCQ